MGNNSGSSRESDFKSVEIIISAIIPELYDTKSYNQLIVSITKCENFFKSMVNPLPAEWMLRALIDFTLSNARRFYSSMGNPLDGKGVKKKINNLIIVKI